MTQQHEALSPITSEQLSLPIAATHSPWHAQQVDWWKHYRNPTLNALIEQALADAPSLKVLATRLKSSNNAADAVRKLSYPTGQVKVDWTGQEFFNSTLKQGTAAPAVLAGVPQDLSDQFIGLASVSAGISWDLDLWGRHRSLYRAALGQARAHQYEYEAARQGLVAQMVALHAQILGLDERINIAQKHIEIQTTLAQRWQERERSGLAPTQNSLQADILAAQLTQLHSSLVGQKAVARAQLAALVGQTPAQLVEFLPEQEWRSLNVPNEVPAQILGTRPDLAAARAYIEASSAQVDAVQAEFYPNINLGLSTALQLLSVQNILNFKGHSAAIQPAITLPIFNTPVLNAKLRHQQAQLDTVVAQYNQAVFQAVSDAHQQLTNYRQANTYLTQQSRIVSNYQRLLGLAQQRFRAGIAPQMEMLMLQSAALREQDNKVMAQAMRRAQEARLISSLGLEATHWSIPTSAPSRPTVTQ